MSSTRTWSGPRSSASRSAASRNAPLMACFSCSRHPVTPPNYLRTRNLARPHFWCLVSGTVRAKDITYDTGFVLHGEISRDHLDPDVVKRELAIIRDDLHCTAVRIIGGDPARIELAATIAADL